MVKVLIVDDSAALHQIYKVVLSKYKCQAISALSGQEGLNALAANPDVNLVIVDIDMPTMPTMSGLEFIRKIKAREAYSKIPIIIVSTKGKKSHVKEALALAQGHVIKPFISADFHRVIDGLLPDASRDSG